MCNDFSGNNSTLLALDGSWKINSKQNGNFLIARLNFPVASQEKIADKLSIFLSMDDPSSNH